MIPRRRIPIDWRTLAAMPAFLVAKSERCRSEVRTFEEQLGRFLGTDAVRCTASGRDAMLLALRGLGLKAGDEILLPALTLGELVPLLLEQQYRVITADVDPDSFNLTPVTIRQAMTPRTRAIMVVHLMGVPCDMHEIREIASAKGLLLIEDCAHAIGATVGDRLVGTFGDAAFFSLEATKPLGTYGGGFVTSPHGDVMQRIGALTSGRIRSEWKAVRRTLGRYLEELLVRSPLYGLVARFLFTPAIATRFEKLYRRLNTGLRVEQDFAGFRAFVGHDRLKGLTERNRRMNHQIDWLARRLPTGFTCQSRHRHGIPAGYALVARFQGDIEQLRRRALARGLDIGIASEVIDDISGHADQPICPVAADIAGHLVQLPVYDGMAPRLAERVLQRLTAAAGDLAGIVEPKRMGAEP